MTLSSQTFGMPYQYKWYEVLSYVMSTSTSGVDAGSAIVWDDMQKFVTEVKSYVAPGAKLPPLSNLAWLDQRVDEMRVRL